ncbi:hypothetical protein [Streptomyces muensis]|uniref:Uncharacterized protein n=1 Tax=Streptomyces muensis TaxID=1077944 RepID=A0A9X1TQY6_STRM4|nr:hypothetical protein [Streptomyces muensis]MCF1599665.1 hypothetical protein [Streptomyces muensis]
MSFEEASFERAILGGAGGGSGARLVRVTVLAVVGLVVALCLPSTGRHAAGDPPDSPNGVAVRGVVVRGSGGPG